VSVSAGVSGTADELGLGAAAADFNNDGWIDLYVANLGFPDRLLINNQDGTFSDRAAAAGLTDLQFHRSVAVGDLNNDGWIDLFAGTEAAPFNKLFFSDGGVNNYLTVSLRGAGRNGFAVGAHLMLYASGRLQVRDITAGDGMTSQNHALAAHFGLGAAAAIDSLVIRWPSGRTETYAGLQINRHSTIVEGIGPNDAPGTFALTAPTDTSVFTFSDDVTASWDRPVDTDDLTYTLTVVDELGQIYSEETGITTTSAVIPGFVSKSISTVQSYKWTVSATDGHSVRRALAIGTFDRIGSLATDGDELPRSTAIASVYPVPASNGISVAYSSHRTQHLTFSIVDVLGRQVSTALDVTASIGDHVENLDVSHLTPGIYFIRVTGLVGVRAKSFLVLN